MKKKTNLTIVIVTYLTNRKILLDCLKSIDKDFKVIIVENSKQFKDKKFFLKKFNNIEIVCTGLNLGYGKGNNFGLEKVQTDYALILNPDVVCKNDFFDKISRIIKKKNPFQLLVVNTQTKQHIYQLVFLIKKNIASSKKNF